LVQNPPGECVNYQLEKERKQFNIKISSNRCASTPEEKEKRERERETKNWKVLLNIPSWAAGQDFIMQYDAGLWHTEGINLMHHLFFIKRQQEFYQGSTKEKLPKN
jgi:hypothetical protein